MHDSDMNDHVIDHDFRNRFVCSWLFNHKRRRNPEKRFTQNNVSVSAFAQTSLVMSVLAIISAVIVVLYIKDEIHDLM